MSPAALRLLEPPEPAEDDTLPEPLLRFIQALAEADEAEDYARTVADPAGRRVPEHLLGHRGPAVVGGAHHEHPEPGHRHLRTPVGRGRPYRAARCPETSAIPAAAGKPRSG